MPRSMERKRTGGHEETLECLNPDPWIHIGALGWGGVEVGRGDALLEVRGPVSTSET